MKVISLSLFGINNKYNNCFNFETYLLFFSVGLRAYRVLFPDWTIYLSLERDSYLGFSEYFDYLKNKAIIEYELKDNNSLCRNMLWRIEPVQFAEYTICRDIDALPTYRERQATEVWLKNNTLAHTITDCDSHNLPMMGGMCSFKKGCIDFSSLSGDFTQKGSDQLFLGEKVYPNLKHSITEHRIKGMSVNENPYCYNYIENIDVSDVKLDETQRIQTNSMVNYIGQCSFHVVTNHHIYENWKQTGEVSNGSGLGAIDFYEEFGDKEFNKSLLQIEKNYKNIFFYA